MKSLTVLILFLVACLIPVNAFGQTAATAKVSGVVTDTNGAVVAGAAVKLIDKTTSAEKTATTNQEGRYVFANIEPGNYDLSVSATGFRNIVITDLKAEITAGTVRDVTLEPGNVAETVTVSGTSDVLLKTEDAKVGNTIEQRRIEQLPLANRGQVTNLLALQPAVSLTGESAGSRADQNTFTLDGLDVSDQVGFRGSTQTVVPVPAESVEEFSATVTNPTASFGRSGGAQVTLVTKRGGNNFHGSVYWYHQNDNLNANSWGNNRLGIRKAEAKDNRFGGSVGGPIWKDHTFFFANYEARRVPGASTQSRTVPRQSLRDGFLVFADATGVPRTYSLNSFDPRGLGANPGILSYLRRFPAPNDLSGANLNVATFTTSIPVFDEDDFAVVRLDHKFTSNWSFEGRGSYYRLIDQNAAQTNIADLKHGANILNMPKNWTFAVVGTPRSNLVNEARYGRAYDHFALTVIDPSTIAGFNVPIDVAGIDELIDIDTQRARIQSLGGSTDQYVDNVTWTKGAHTFQFGGSLRNISTFHLRNDKVLGSLSFPVTAVGNLTGALAVSPAERPPACSATVTTNCLPTAQANTWNTLYTSLLGIIDNTSYLATRDASLQPNPIGTPLINDAKLRHWEFYFADTWRLNSSVTASFGIQYQWHTPPKDELDRQTLLAYRNTGQLIDPLTYLQQKAQHAEHGVIFNPDISYIPVKEAGKDVFKINRGGFSPRLSVAWQPSFKDGLLGSLFGGRRTVIRGGYALLYDRLNTVSSVVVPMLGVGFAQTLSIRAPRNGANQPFRVGIDGPIAVPVNTAVSSPVVPGKPFAETLSFTLSPNIKDPYNHSIDFTVQRELPADMVVEVGYIGRFARNLYQNLNLNTAPYFFRDTASGQRFAEAFDAVAAQLRTGTAPGAVTQQPWFENQLPGAPGGGTRFMATQQTANFISGNLNNLWNTFIDILPFVGLPGSLPSGPYNNIQSLDLFVRTSRGRSTYNALFVTAKKRMSRGLMFDANYTLSRSLDQVGGIQNFVTQLSSSFDPEIDYAPSDFDRLHNLNVNFLYDLPFGNGRRWSAGNGLDKVIGGWYVSGIYQHASGLPLTVVQGNQVFGAGAVFGAATGARPINEDLDMSTAVRTGVPGSAGIGTTNATGLNLFANPEEVYKNFRRILLSSDTRSGRGALRGLPVWGLSLSLGKETRINERMKFTITADFFNVDNHPQFNNPGLSIAGQSTFGVITSAGGNRQIQLGARFEF